MNNLKVAIIGAGISGLYLSWKLAERGDKVTVFEKRKTIGKEVCSGLFSERIFQFLPESRKLIQNQIDYCLIHFPKRTLKIHFNKKFFVMSHSELDRLVAELSENNGVKIILNYNITKSVLDVLQKEFDKIIGCDGPNSIVRESLGLPKPKYRLAIQGFVLKEDFSKFIETWPTKSGFIWRIPRGEKREYGIIEKPERARKLFNEFLKEKNLSLKEMRSALVPQGLIIPKNNLITLAGDAVGLTKPWSGGGVIWGLTAANILLKNFPDFLKYQYELKKRFLPEIILSRIITRIFYFLGFGFPWIFPKKIRIEGDFLT